MQFFLTLLGLVGMASAAVRLPLPLEIIKLHPELMHEPVHSDNRIHYGKPVEAGEGMYQIGLKKSNSFICGGSIISPRTILTAAHCVHRSEDSPQLFKVIYGSPDRINSKNEANVVKIIRHEKYSSNTIDYDVAVLILEKDILPSDNAEANVLDSAIPSPSADLRLTGWGRNENSALPGILQKADSLRYMPTPDCQKKWGSVNSITPRMMCVEAKEQSACNGDSGGPLIDMATRKQVGVVSWGANGCKINTYPNVFASVPDLKEWIDRNTV